MSEVAQIEGRVRYSAFKKTVKVMITPTDSLDNLKAQLNTYFEYLGENQYTRHLFGQMPCIDLGEDRDEYAWKTASYMPLLIRDDGDVGFMFQNMVKTGQKNGLEMFRIMQTHCLHNQFSSAVNFQGFPRQLTAAGFQIPRQLTAEGIFKVKGEKPLSFRIRGSFSLREGVRHPERLCFKKMVLKKEIGRLHEH
ncbi:hypothetical protein MTR_2g013850 [Medicago truncatula]|uniref:Uncharacterized protein n=1 Tax=Medicago truncatula TaxID=3880 RepID=G7IPU1_MEDTR|nr:hypothetical protein MTR_2g013850 [Medicago truncatula]